MRVLTVATMITAIGLSGPLAAQGINLSGSAEMGLASTATTLPDGAVDRRTELLTDLDLTISAMWQTDGGMRFGFNIDLDDLADGDDTRNRPSGAITIGN